MSAAAQRRAMAAGVAFVVLFIAGVIVNFSNTPEIKSSDTAATASRKWVIELSSSGHRVGIIISAYLLMLAALALVWFCIGLGGWLTTSQKAGRAIAGLGVLGASAIAVASLLGGAGIAGAVEFGESPLPQNGEAIRVVAELFFPFLFVVFGLASAAIIATLTVAAARTQSLPRWLVYAGWVAVLGSILGVIFFPLILPLLWYLIVAIVGYTRSGHGESTPTAAPAPAPGA
jgi:hypothetical protein